MDHGCERTISVTGPDMFSNRKGRISGNYLVSMHSNSDV